MATTEETETLAERQENELQVLQSIYQDDVVDMREHDAWKVARPPEIKIMLQPQESMSTNAVYNSITLYIKCPVDYPESVPEIQLMEHKGLSDQHVRGLQTELESLSKSLIGEVMILELSQHVQKFLHAHNKPPKKSFYDEMMSNKKRQEEQQERQRQESLARLKENEEKQQKKIEEEIQRRQDTLREEARKRRQEAKQGALDRRSSSEPSSGGGSEPVLVTPIPKDTEQRKRVSVTPERQTVIAESGSYQKPERRRRTTSTPKKDSESEESSKCTDHTGVLVLAFNTKKERMVHRGRCLGHSLRGCTQYAGMDTDTGELVAVTEWTLQWRNPKRKLDLDDKDEDKEQATNYMKQVSSIESEFMSLLRLRHQNLTHYLAFKYSQSIGVITVHVLSEFISGGSLSNVLQNKVAVPVEEIRHYTVQLVDVLNYLHGKAVVHKHLRLSSAMLDPYGRVRLADYSIDNRLAELFATVDATRPGVHFADEKPLAPGRSGKKCDIYMLGIMLLSLAQGVVVSDLNQSIPTSLPEELQDFLSKCLDHNERARWSAAQLQEHTFVKTPVHRQLSEVNGREDHTKHNNKGLADEEEDDAVSAIPFIPSSEGGHSRLKNEFEILRWLGKGGFGDVIKVKNKLDGRFYAIKRIPLNPRSKHFTRKITREVKLLSRLNHENVVRYYNSWIEISEEPALSDSTSAMDTTSAESPSPAKPLRVTNLTAPAKCNSFGICDNFDMNVPATANSSIDWSISMSGSRQMADNESSSSEDDDEGDDDENDVFGVSFRGTFLGDSEDDSIVFECGDSTDNATPSEAEKSEKETVARGEESVLDTTTPLRLQFLYIQMEFCEKSTLRDCIDQGLYEDRDRVWRLFREICEGLSHIHQQGMIHRDLKPVNIFLDSDDQVKIGDFGLATTNILSQQHTSFIDMNITPALNLDSRVNSSKSESLGDGKLTGKVGTALYVSPEIMNTSTASRTHYSQKVDIYSLGVMFFEMCYPPLPTGMERIEVLTALRQPSITLPDNFDPKNDMLDQIAILKLLLNHDPALRPTAEQLLASELLPPPHIEEAELTELFRSTLKQPDTKAYRHMISAIFGQRVDPVTDITFDIDLYKRDQTKFTPTPLLIQRSVTETLERIFEKHGALRLSTPLLMPKSTLYEHCEQYITMMDSSGGLVSLPYDLRVPFARYVARNNVTSLKRYTVERVYRQKRHPNNCHPRELTECAVDIITPTPSSLLPDAELLHVVSDIINEFPILKTRNYFLRLNHAMLLRGVLLHCGIAEELYQEVCHILSGAEVQQRLHIQTRLGNLSISDESIMNLYRFIENEGPFGKVASMLRCITKTKGQAASYAKQGLHEMEAIINHAESLNCKLQPVLAMGLVYNMQYYSGTVYQVASRMRRKNRTTMEVLAAGGRYDNLVSKFTKLTSSRGHQGVPSAAVGISISFERLIAARQDDFEWHSRGIVDVLVSSLGQKPLNREKLGVAADLWSVGLRTHVVYDTTQSLEEIQELGRAMGASQIVILKDLDSGYAKVRSVEKDRVSEKKVQLSDLTNFLQQRVASANCEIPESIAAASTKLTTQVSQGAGETWGSSISTSGGSGGGGSNQSINITLITPDKNKIAANTKRRYESQIYNNITGVASVISNKTRIEVIGVELPSSAVKTIATNLEVGQDEAAFETSISSIMEKHARRDERKYMNKIFEEIHDLKFANNRSSVIVLYGLKDDTLHVFF